MPSPQPHPSLAYGLRDVCRVSDLQGCPYCFPDRTTDLNGVLDLDRGFGGIEGRARLLEVRLDHLADRHRRLLPLPEALVELARQALDAGPEVDDADLADLVRLRHA